MTTTVRLLPNPSNLIITINGRVYTGVVNVPQYVNYFDAQVLISNGWLELDQLVGGRIFPRIQAVATGSSVTPDADTADVITTYNRETAGTLSMVKPTGTPYDGQQLVMRIKCDAIQTMSWASTYRGSGDVSLPVTTTGFSKTDYWGFRYNYDDSKWDFVSIVGGFA